MMNCARHLWCAVAATTLAGCVSAANDAVKSPLVPDKAIRLTASTTVSLEAVAAGAVVFAVIDPLAPNWQVETRLLDGRRYAVALTMKRFVTGGDGEARQVFARAAERLVQQHGAGGYQVAAYSEGIESTVPVARRVAHGIVELR